MVSNIDLVKWFFPKEKEEIGKEKSSNVMQERIEEYKRKRNEYLLDLHRRTEREELEVLEISTRGNHFRYRLEEAERFVKEIVMGGKPKSLEFLERRGDSPYTRTNFNELLNELEKELRKGSYYTQKPLYLKELEKSSEEI